MIAYYFTWSSSRRFITSANEVAVSALQWATREREGEASKAFGKGVIHSKCVPCWEDGVEAAFTCMHTYGLPAVEAC